MTEKVNLNLFKNNKFFLSVFLGIILILGLTSYNLYKDSQLYRTLLSLGIDAGKSTEYSTSANAYYSEASLFYESREFSLVESNCRLARDNYLKASQELKNLKSKINALSFKDELLDLYVNMIDTNIKINNNMYEACEHFESASRYYAIYYSPATSPDDPSYDMGGQELEMMNEKIVNHDLNVEVYNQYLADFNTELEERLN